MANNFLPFAPTDTGTNLLSQVDYAAATDRTIGNQPGVASAKLVNKALRQAAYISSQFAQFLSDKLGADLLDDATPARLLSQINAVMLPIAPIVTKYTPGSGSFNRTFYFYIATGNATIGATYTNNSFTFTVKATVASGTVVACTGTGVPSVNGTLTKSGGTGDSALVFYAFKQALYMKVLGAGGGGGSAGSGTSGTGGAGGNGGNTTFGTSLLVANGGVGGTTSGGGGDPSNGGTASLGTGPVGVAVQGGSGGCGNYSASTGTYLQGGRGGNNPLGGGGAECTQSAADPGIDGTGGGAAGPGTNAVNSIWAGAGGGAGGFFDAIINAPLAVYAWAVGGGGTAGAAGTSGTVGEVGGAGTLVVTEVFQ